MVGAGVFSGKASLADALFVLYGTFGEV